MKVEQTVENIGNEMVELFVVDHALFAQTYLICLQYSQHFGLDKEITVQGTVNPQFLICTG